MGWLRELMVASGPRFRSYGALARAALKHPAWPGASRPKPRSLATLFSKLDRSQETEWLQQRPGVQSVLAELLGVPGADIRRALDPGARDEGPQPRLRLDDLRYARAVDLVEESLPPGIPADVLRPAGWQGLWWVAPAGGGRGLAGRWLEARGLARREAGPELERILANQVRGPIYLEVPEQVPERVPAPPPFPVCVAATMAPPPGRGWRVVASPDPGEWLDDLVSWVEDRVPKDGQFDVDATRTLLRRLHDRRLITDLGTALGLCGLSDELGKKELRQAPLDRLARRFLLHRTRDLGDDQAEEARLLRKRGWDLLVDLGRALIVDPERPWDAARSPDDWLDLVPTEHQVGADVEWLRLALADDTSRLQPRDVDRAVRRLPPGAHRIIRAFRSAGLLRGPTDGPWTLGPRWLGAVVTAEAQQALVDGSPFEWGEALLAPHGAPAMERRVLERVRRDEGPFLEAILEMEASESPAQAAATEAAFCACGLALLEGADAPEPLAELWDAGLTLAVVGSDGVPTPRLLGATRGATFSDGAWLLAALAIAEHLPVGEGRRHGLLRPWGRSDAPRGLADVLDRIALHIEPTSAHRLHAVALVDRLRHVVGRAADAIHPLERPGVVLEEIQHDCLEWRTVLGLDPAGTDALEWLAAQRGVSWRAVGSAIWTAWQAAGCPQEGADLFQPEARDAARLWSTIPDPLLEVLLEDRLPRGQSVPLEAFGDDQWSVFVRVWPRVAGRCPDARRWWMAVPEAGARRALAEDGLSASDGVAIDALWRRFPDLMGNTTRVRLATGSPERAVVLMVGAPPARTAELAEALADRLSQPAPDAFLRAARAWLHERVRRRSGDWRSAYRILDVLEQELARLPTPLRQPNDPSRL